MSIEYFASEAFHQLVLEFLKAHDLHFAKQYSYTQRKIFLELCIVFLCK